MMEATITAKVQQCLFRDKEQVVVGVFKAAAAIDTENCRFSDEDVKPAKRTAKDASLESPSASTSSDSTPSPCIRAAKKKAPACLQLKTQGPLMVGRPVQLIDQLVVEDNHKAKNIMFELKELGLENSISLIGLSHWPNETEARRRSLFTWLNYLTLDLMDKALGLHIDLENLDAGLRFAQSMEAAKSDQSSSVPPSHVTNSPSAAAFEAKIAETKAQLDKYKAYICTALTAIQSNKPFFNVMAPLPTAPIASQSSA